MKSTLTSLPSPQLQSMIAALSATGYKTIAVARVGFGKLKKESKCDFDPKYWSRELQSPNNSSSSSQLLGPHGRAQGGGLRILSRITVVVEDLGELEDMSTLTSVSVLSSYDIVAVQVTSQQTFQAACERDDIDLITFDYSQRLRFHLSLKSARAAHARGVRFELCYASALQDPAGRRHIFATARSLSEVVGGHGLVLSSGASNALYTRGPFDVSNLASLMGIGQKGNQEAHDCVSIAPLQVIARAKAKREAVLGVEPAPTSNVVKSVLSASSPSSATPPTSARLASEKRSRLLVGDAVVSQADLPQKRNKK
eukprot:CAMPEP_0171681856 /NCGR_PEP_ID=MMETSP0991-20121206/189_1 /TAXON_ID=483369 /ORGANISM="non described non described, Strain CCMP2098" /LENGTH=311 /DNA_ID=CAMNT_0012268967 /DNA_START=62 /DNA_END=997 /DNA_ORIENTATION=+